MTLSDATADKRNSSESPHVQPDETADKRNSSESPQARPLSNREIARRVGVDEKTVRNHLKRAERRRIEQAEQARIAASPAARDASLSIPVYLGRFIREFRDSPPIVPVVLAMPAEEREAFMRQIVEAEAVLKRCRSALADVVT